MDADIEEIITEKPYPKVDASKLSMTIIKLSLSAIFHRRPTIKKLEHKIADYDLVIICLPVWANNMAPPLNTFIANWEFEHKNAVIVITTDPKRASEHALYDVKHKMDARGATVIHEDSVAVLGVPDEEIANQARAIALNLKPLVDIGKPIAASK